ncbi:MAG: Na/Pi cotransporter family protein [Firmicutes bacterium]|nr:Na/Pi cotransporter family protein [Bacillota bacterium]
MNLISIVTLLGGLALFLYGVTLMGDGLGKVAGDKLQLVLYKLTSNPLKGILLGAGITALIQSSTAASVMVIGFVNAGLMVFKQAVSVILGSIVGTSVTGWIVSLSSIGGGSGWTAYFSTAFITGIMAVIGIVLLKFSSKPKRNQIGTILLGFAVLMFGMSTMSQAVTPLKESEDFISMLTSFSNPVLGILVGIVFTAIIQSSAAAVGILQALSMTGALTFATAYPITLGIAVGGALPVLISAIGANINARRTALTHLVIDILGAVFCGIVFYAVNAVVHFGFMSAHLDPVTVALLNTIFRIVTVVVLTPMIGLLEKIVCTLIKDEPVPETPGGLLEERFLEHPVLAIEQSRIALNTMAERSRKDLMLAFEMTHDYSDAMYDKVRGIEKEVDNYEDNLSTYLVKIATKELTSDQNEEVYRFLHAITDLEEISDYAMDIAKRTREIHARGLSLRSDVQESMRVMEAALTEIVDTAIKALIDHDMEAARRVEPLEENIVVLCREMKQQYMDNVRNEDISVDEGFVLHDLIDYYERISMHCSSIAVALIELDLEALGVRNYTVSLRQRRDAIFKDRVEEYRNKYNFDDIDDVEEHTLNKQ